MSEQVAEATETPRQPAQKPRTQKVGRVVSDKMEKTVVVAVDNVRRHPLYHKRMTRTNKFLAHDESRGYRQNRGDAAAFEAEALDRARDRRARGSDLMSARGRRAQQAAPLRWPMAPGRGREQ
jgi:ribosomal protein S17